MGACLEPRSPRAPAPAGYRARFARDASGVSAVEFALLAPVFFGIVFMLCQIGLYIYYSASLSNATNRAARKIMIGDVAQTANLTADVFRNQVLCPLLPGMMTCDNIVTNAITVPVSGSFAGQSTPPMDNTKTSFCIGQGGSYVVLQVYYAMPVLGIPAMLSGAITYKGAPSVFINSNVVFLNEPFLSSYAGC